jgi:ribonuclease HIII
MSLRLSDWKIFPSNKLPKGTASNGSVLEVARVIAARDGDETLRGLVKWHHTTTQKVVGMQEPDRVRREAC